MSTLLIVKVTALFVFSLLIIRLMRSHSSAARHAVIVVTFASVLILPVLETVAPQWQILPATAVSSPVLLTTPQSTAQLPLTHKAYTASGDTPAVATIRTSLVRVSLWHIWAAGACVLLMVLLVRIAAMQRVVQRAKPFQDQRWIELRDQLCQQLGIKSDVQLRQRSTDTMPCVWGLFSPVVLLPADCHHWSIERRRDVMAHEFAHIRRRDVMSVIFTHIACAVYWFHPLAWWLKNRLETECEHACDDLAIARSECASSYADHLLNTAVAYHQPRGLAPVMAARSQMEGRIMAILDTRRCRSGITKRVVVFAAAAAAAALVPLSGMAQAESGKSARAQMTHASDSAGFAQHLATFDRQEGRVNVLLSALESDNALTRATAAWALEEYDNVEVVDALIRTSYDTDATVRQWSIRSLSSKSAPSIATMLQSQLQDNDAEVREWATRALAQYDSTDAQRAIADRLAVETSNEVSEWLIRSIHDVKDPVRLNALISALSHPHSDVRQWAARGLDQVSDDHAVDALINTLGDRDDEVREWSARSLAMCGNERAIAPLQALAQDPNSDVREWAHFALKKIRC